LRKRLELSVHFFKRGASPLCLYLAVLLSLVACSNKTTDVSFSYKLSQQAFQSELVSPLTLQVQGNDIGFAIAFKGGGGAYDEACLKRSEDIVRVMLFDIDSEAQKMFVVYQLSGSISDLKSGHYTFQIVDTDGRLIAEDVFTIQ